MPDIIPWLLVVLVAAGTFFAARSTTVIREGEVGLLLRDGRFERELAPGRYRRFDPARRTEIISISTMPDVQAVGTVNVTTRDQFALRLSAAVRTRVSDPLAFHRASRNASPIIVGIKLPATRTTPLSWLQPVVSAALTRHAAQRTLD